MHNPAWEALRPHRKHGEGQVSSHGGKQGRQVPQQTSPVLLPAPRLPWETALPKAAARAAAPALSEGKVGTTRGGPSCPTTPPPQAGLSSWGSNLGLPDLTWGWGWRGEGEGGRGAAQSQVLALRKETEISRFCCCPTEPPRSAQRAEATRRMPDPAVELSPSASLAKRLLDFSSGYVLPMQS